MLNNTKIALIFFLITVIGYGCKKGSPNDNPIVNPITNNLTPGQVTISGTVTKSDGTAADNITVSIGSATVTTAADGTYSYTGVVADSNKVVIKFSKPGYIDTWRTLAIESGAIYNNINVDFFAPGTTSFNAATGGAASIAYIGLTMTFAANCVVKSDGTTYAGTVVVETPNVGSFSLDQLASGDERAIDANNSQVVLEPYSGWYFRLKGQAGEALKLSKPMTYSCRMMTANTPTPLKLWYFNEATGLWAESAGAAVVNNAYVGSTSNQGFLQLAVPYVSTLLRLTVKDALNNIPAGFKIQSARFLPNSLDYVGPQQATINSKGICLAYVPASAILNLTLLSPCDRMSSIGVQPLPPAVKTEQSITPILTKYITSVTGRVEDCTFQPLSGRAQLNVNGIIYTTTLVNGSYIFNVIACGTQNAILTVYDANNKVLVQNPYIALFGGSASVVPATSTCTNPITGTFTYTVAGKTYTLTTPTDQITYETDIDPLSGKIMTMLRGNGVGKGFYLSSLNTTAGTYNIYTGDFYGGAGYDYFVTWGLFTPGTVTYTKYKSGTTIVQGTFNANTTLNFCVGCPNVTVGVTGSFKLDQ